jgi:DNA-binding LacI/PurR family transcriptional regulator
MIQTKKSAVSVTSINVAQLANVSQSTVSRVLNGKDIVKQETVERVLGAIKELGYQPNAIARSLTSRKTDIVAVVSVNSNHSFYINIINNISRTLSKNGKQILYFQVKFDENLEDIFNLVYQYQVDGLIIISAAVSPSVTKACEKMNLPLAIFNRLVQSASVYSVCSDNLKASRMVADYLAGRGYRSFGFIGSTVMTNISNDRETGFREQISSLGFADPLVEHGQFTYQSGWEAMRRMAETQKRRAKKIPEAIFCSNDLMAMGAMDYIRFNLGLSLPRDAAIIGFDAIEEGAWEAYNISTVEQPIAAMTDTLCNYLLKRMNTGSGKQEKVLFDCKIIERGTT